MKHIQKPTDPAAPSLFAKYQASEPENYHECTDLWCWECVFDESYKLNYNKCKIRKQFKIDWEKQHGLNTTNN